MITEKDVTLAADRLHLRYAARVIRKRYPASYIWRWIARRLDKESER